MKLNLPRTVHQMVLHTVILTVLGLVLYGCSSPSGPNQSKSEISLSLIDVSVNLSYIRVSVPSPITSGEVIKVYRNGSPVFSFQALKDTILSDTALTPSTDYSYSAIIYKDNKEIGKSENLSLRTSSTTSSSISWQVFKFGTWGSVIRDILIINDDDIWAVGNIYKSAYNDTLYNALHWDGHKWDYFSIPIRIDYGATIFNGPVQLMSIFKTQDNSLCITSEAGGLSFYDGKNWTCVNIPPFPYPSPVCGRIWGTTKDNLYFANATGTITHYDGRKFEFLETGNKIYLTDIYGTSDGKEIWACGYDLFTLESVLLKVNGNKVETIHENYLADHPLYGKDIITSLWCTDKGFFVLSGGGYDYYTQSYLNRNISSKTTVNNGTGPYRIRGTGLNDVFVTGDDAVVWHYDGLKWTDDRSQQILYSILCALDVKNNLIVTGGSGPNGSYAFIMLGRR